MWLLLALPALSYLWLVRILRFRRLRAMHLAYAGQENSDKYLKNMTPITAQKIVHESLFYETPTIMLLGTQIALFKVYGISTIASLLIKTGQMKAAPSKRLADVRIMTL